MDKHPMHYYMQTANLLWKDTFNSDAKTDLDREMVSSLAMFMCEQDENEKNDLANAKQINLLRHLGFIVEPTCTKKQAERQIKRHTEDINKIIGVK